MALKFLSVLYIGFGLFALLVLVAPGNAKEMFLWSDSRAANGVALLQVWSVWVVVAACGISAWAAPQHMPLLAWSVVAVAGLGHLFVALVRQHRPSFRRLVVGAAIQASAAIAVSWAARHGAEG